MSTSLDGPEPVRVVTLELLRHGPDHNQLLSPLTPYLALCGNHDPETVHVSMEHLRLLRRIQLLRYESGVELAAAAQHEAAEEMTRLLGSIHSLTAELATSDPAEERRMVHLRLILSASELAMLPFELANAFAGLPGQGQPLCLQTVSPLCLTREVRRVAAVALEWPRKVRILVISAAPPPVSSVPLREHLAALRVSLAPYMVRGDNEEFDSLVTVVPEASLAAVREACHDNRGDPYTHVHVLAHGISTDAPASAGSRYGLAFHADHNPHEVDIVSGTRLATALRCHVPGRRGQELARPAVLTIASCDSANMGMHSVLSSSGASVAHELHEAGIPLVIGSQFPLSVKGSVVMTEVLYQRLLRGHDPRKVIHDLRQALMAEVPEAPNDWASIVTYAAFPSDLPVQLATVRFERARLELDTVMARLDLFEQEPPPAASKRGAFRTRLLGLRAEMKEAMKRLRDAVPTGGGREERMNALGVLASAGKQVAWFLGPTGVLRETAAEDALGEEFRQTLREARRDYYTCYQAGNIDSWPLVQYLALTVALDERWNGPEFRDRWTAAVVMSRDALRSDHLQRRVWALGALAELRIMEAAWEDPEVCYEQALEHVEQLFDIVDLAGYGDAQFDAYSLYRQIRRYYLWEWGTPDMIAVAILIGTELDRRGVPVHWTRTTNSGPAYPRRDSHTGAAER